MPENTELSSDTSAFLEEILRTAESVYVKKLSNNDRDWADNPKKHQWGVYVPHEERDSGFFPRLASKVDAEGDEIREVFFEIDWPQVGKPRTARLANYTSKGEETHLTRVPKPAFRDLSPASFLLIGRFPKSDKSISYRAITIDSTTDDADTLTDFLEVSPDEFSFIRYPQDVLQDSQKRAWSFLETVLRAYQDGTVASLKQKMPAPGVLASLARERFSEREGITSFDPFELDSPGDVLRQLSRVDEWEIFKELQLQIRSVELVQLLVGEDAKKTSVESIIAAVITDYSMIDALFLSASQQRKSRAGTSFELHIERLLIDGRVPFAKQTVVSSRRPDFVLPSLKYYKQTKRESGDAIVLSAKTTLRERWKQVVSDGINCSLFLATVDENVSAVAIEEMAGLEITLVVPESLKSSTITEYGRHDNVVDFKSFFEDEVRKKRSPKWI